MNDRDISLYDEIERLASGATDAELTQLLEEAHPADVADALFDLPDPIVERVFLCLDVEEAADVLSYMDSLRASKVMPDLMPTERLSDIVEEMDPDDAADFIGSLDEAQQTRLLDEMEDEDSREIQTLLEYDPYTAGGKMTTEVACVRDDMTVDQAIEVLRGLSEDHEISALFVVDAERKLVGRLRMRSLVLHRGARRVGDVMDPEIVSVPAGMDQEEVARTVERYDLTTLPVVGPDGTLLGQVTVDDVIDVMTQEHSEDVFRLAGSSSDELSLRTPLAIAKLRLPWLLITVGAGLLSSRIIASGEGAVAHMDLRIFAAIAPFFPVLMAMGGNTGLQSATIVTRGLATKSFELDDLWDLLWREGRVGLLLGVLCGVLVGGAAFLLDLFTGSGDYNFGPFLGVVVATSMSVTIPLSCLMGTLAPMIMARWGVDPAIAAGPFITMSNDFFSLLIYFMLTLMMFQLFYPGGLG